MLKKIMNTIFKTKDLKYAKTINNSIIASHNDKTSNDTKSRFFSREMQEWLNLIKDKFYNNYSYYENNACPNCGTVLEEKIKRSKKCPLCKKKIVTRTNQETLKKLLFTEKDVIEYDKLDKKRSDIIFFENQIEALNNMYPNYMYYFWDLIKEKPDMSARDYAWSFENWLYNKIDMDTINDYKQNLNLSFSERVLKCDKNVIDLKRSSNVFRYMIDIAIYKEKFNVAEEMMLSFMYRNVAIALLPYFHWDDRPKSEIQFYSDVSFGMGYVKDYLDKHHINFEELEDKFMQKAHPFLFNIVTKEEAWQILCEAYKRYIYTIGNNEHY